MRRRGAERRASGVRLVPPRVLFARLSLALPLACAGQGPQAVDGDGGADGGGTTTAQEPGDDLLEAPKIIDPAGDELIITSDRVTAIEIGVADIIPGRTQVLLDGVAMIVAGQPSSRGELSDDTLSLAVGGALGVGSHDLELLTAGSSFPLRSRKITLKIAAAPPVTPVVGAPSLFAAPPFESLVLGDAAVGLWSRQDPTTLRVDVVPAHGGSFDIAARKGVLLPRLVSNSDLEAGFCLALLAPSPASDLPPESLVLRIAWRLDASPRSIAVYELPWDEVSDGMVLSPSAELELPAEAKQGKESVHIDALTCLRESVLATATIHADSELPAIGDAAAFVTAWQPQASIAPLVRLPTSQGLDMRDPQRVWALPPRTPAVELLVQNTLTRQYELFEDSLAIAVVPVDLQRTGPTVAASSVLASVRAALNTRQSIEVRPDGAILHVLNESQAATKSSNATGIPMVVTPTSAAVTTAVIMGRAIFVVPHGSATPSTLFRTNGNVATGSEGPACDAVALAPTTAAASDTALLCLRQGAISTHVISLQP